MSAIYDSARRVAYAPKPTACEVTCGFCSHTFYAMRLRRGKVKCPDCGHPAAKWAEAPAWRSVPL